MRPFKPFRQIQIPKEREVTEQDPLEHLVEGEIMRVVREQLSRLPPHERDAIAARTRYSDRSCRCVAQDYGVSPQTVCNWADAAERKLRSVLEAFH